MEVGVGLNLSIIVGMTAADEDENEDTEQGVGGGGGGGGYEGETDYDLPAPSVPSFPPNMRLPAPDSPSEYRPPPPPLPAELSIGPTITLGLTCMDDVSSQHVSASAQPVQAEPVHVINTISSDASSHQVGVPTAVPFVNGSWAKSLCSCSCGLCLCCAVTFCFCITIGQLWERVMKSPGACKTISIGLWVLCIVIFICGSISDGGQGEVYEIFSTLTGAANFALLVVSTILIAAVHFAAIRVRSARSFIRRDFRIQSIISSISQQAKTTFQHECKGSTGKRQPSLRLSWCTFASARKVTG
eukprot:746307-Hanusia_phi.AAC.1